MSVQDHDESWWVDQHGVWHKHQTWPQWLASLGWGIDLVTKVVPPCTIEELAIEYVKLDHNKGFDGTTIEDYTQLIVNNIKECYDGAGASEKDRD